jgi:hypothetical protein
MQGDSAELAPASLVGPGRPSRPPARALPPPPGGGTLPLLRTVVESKASGEPAQPCLLRPPALTPGPYPELVEVGEQVARVLVDAVRARRLQFLAAVTP